MRPPLRPDTLRGEFIGIPSFHDEERGSIGVEDLGGAASLGAVAAVGPLEVAEAQPGLEIGGPDVLPGVRGTPDRDPLVDGPRLLAQALKLLPERGIGLGVEQAPDLPGHDLAVSRNTRYRVQAECVLT